MNAAIVLLSHLILAGLLVASFEAVEYLIGLFGQGHDTLVFDTLPLRYIFQAVDVGMIALFAGMGFKEAYEVLR